MFLDLDLLSFGEKDPKEILRLSYLFSVPVVLVSTAYLLIFEGGGLLEAWPALISSFVVGLFSLSLLLKLVERIKFFWFILVLSALYFLGGIVEMLG